MKKPVRTHVWLTLHEGESTIMIFRLPGHSFELRCGEGITRCRMLSTLERPLVATRERSLSDCSRCEEAS